MRQRGQGLRQAIPLHRVGRQPAMRPGHRIKHRPIRSVYNLQIAQIPIQTGLTGQQSPLKLKLHTHTLSPGTGLADGPGAGGA